MLASRRRSYDDGVADERSHPFSYWVCLAQVRGSSGCRLLSITPIAAEKWMLSIKTSEVDEWWSKVRAATESGLPRQQHARVAAMKPNPNSRKPGAAT